MFDAWLRACKDRLLAAPGRWMAQWATPNLLTLLALVAGIAAALLLAHARHGWGLCLWILNRLLDGLDGTVARLTGRQSDLGGYLDILSDVVVYALVPISLVWAAPSSAAWTALAWLLASFYLNIASWMYLSALLEKRAQGAAARGERTAIVMPPGLVAGGETVVFYTLFILFPGYLPVLFSLMAVGVGLAVAQRVVWAIRRL